MLNNRIVLIDFFLDWPPERMECAHMLHQSKHQLHVIGKHQYKGNLESVFYPYSLSALAEFVGSMDVTLIAGRHPPHGWTLGGIIKTIQATRTTWGLMGSHPYYPCLVRNSVEASGTNAVIAGFSP